MPVAFGWSAGDIAKAIELLTTVYKGLKDARGAASEYQDIADFLRGLILTLQHLQTLQLECIDLNLVKAVQTLSKAALDPIFQFLEDISKYEPGLNRRTTDHKFKSGYRKAEWSLRIPKRLVKLKADIAMELEPIHLLLESESLKQSARAASRLCSIQSGLQLQALEQTNFNSTLMSAVEDLKISMQTMAISPGISIDPAIQKPSHSATNGDRTSVQHPQSALVSTNASQLSAEMLEQWKEVGQEMYVLLLKVLTKFAVLTRYLLSISPQLILFLRTFFVALPKVSRLLVQDDIHFEDVLGRVHHLPYQYFSHWQVFHPYLKEIFRNQLGEDYIERREFRVINATHGWVIMANPSDWSRSVHPGSRIAMSVLISSSLLETACPRCRTRLEEVQGSRFKYFCPSCSWERYTFRLVTAEVKQHWHDPSWAPTPNRSLSDQERAIFKRVHAPEVDITQRMDTGPQGSLTNQQDPDGGHPTLQDYQLQLMLLEQQNKKRLLMARQEQESLARQDQDSIPGPHPSPNLLDRDPYPRPHRADTLYGTRRKVVRLRPAGARGYPPPL